MNITIDTESDVPLFTQLIEQIKNAVVNEQLNPGDALPSIRQLANDLAVNNKTVAKAYQLLERDSVIQTKGYRGTYIHPEALQNCGVDLNQIIVEQLGNVISNLRVAGATDSEIRNAFQQVMNRKVYEGDSK